MSNKVLCRDEQDVAEVVVQIVKEGYSYCVVGRMVYYWS